MAGARPQAPVDHPGKPQSTSRHRRLHHPEWMKPARSRPLRPWARGPKAGRRSSRKPTSSIGRRARRPSRALVVVERRRERLAERPRAVERADEPRGGRIELGGEREPALEPERQALRLPAAVREPRLLRRRPRRRRRAAAGRAARLRRARRAGRASRTASARAGPPGAARRAAAAAPRTSRRGRPRACAGRGTRSRAARSRARGSTRASGRSRRRTPRAGRAGRGSTRSRSRSGRRSRCGAGTRRSPSPRASCAGAAAGSSGSSAQAIEDATRTRPARAPPALPRTTCSETASPRMPLSRNRYALSGETTYGGFATTRSNCSPSTGSKKLPSRVSTLRDAVERRVELRVGERPRVHVGRDDVLGVRGEQDRLDPVAGAQVERALARAANGQVRERDRRAVHARHVVGVLLRPRRRGRTRSAARREGRARAAP